MDRDRHRLRARVLIDAEIDDEWNVILRLATGGSNSATSTNQTLDDNFTKKRIWLDLAYFDYHPITKDGLNVFGGKMKNPFYSTGKNQLIWDSDVNPEGLAARYSIKHSIGDINFVCGGFWLDEKKVKEDATMLGVQAYLKQDDIVVGVSRYNYSNLGDDRNSNLNTIELFSEYGPLYASWASGSYLIGAKVSKDKVSIGYDYRELDDDAVHKSFDESDFIGKRGHKLYSTYSFSKKVKAGIIWYQTDQRIIQVDLKLKF